MKKNTLLIVFACLLGLILAAGIGFILYMELPGENVPTEPSTAATTEPTAETTVPVETTAATTEPSTEPTTEPTTAPTEPQPTTYTLTFAGDCTLANQAGRTGSETFIATVGEDYAYPFADVQEYFANDDCTFINLENALTTRGTPASKQFVFRGPPSYVNILTQGSVEFANLANNHAMDYGEVGYQDTADTLKNAGIWYGGFNESVLFTTESGLTIGVYTSMEPKNAGTLQNAIRALKDQGADIVIGCFHWGGEYYYTPSANQKKMARAAIDAGADIIFGHHPHVLQPIEHYKDGVILYSLGNFSFGGNPDPGDKDTAIIQQQIIRDVDGSIHMGELTIIPCHVTGTIYVGNDYQPVPMEETFAGYQRVLKKLNGTWPIDRLNVSYREDLNTEPTTEPTDPNAPTDPTDPNAPTEPTDPNAPTEPAEPTDPADTPTEPAAPTDPPAPTPDPEPEPEPAPEPEPEPEPAPAPSPSSAEAA